MKKTMFFKAAMAAFLSLVVFACDPVEPEVNDGEKPDVEKPNENESEVPVEVERSIQFYNADAEVETLEFTAEATTYTLTVKANFQWDVDKDATTWPAWLVKLNNSVTGVLNETSELYESNVTLTLDVANIASYYENKTGNLVFTDANDLEYTFEFPVSHTFEKPVEPESILSNALGTNILTVTTDGKIKGTDSNELEITITPGEGQTGFKGFPVAYISYPNGDDLGYDWAPCVNAEKGTNSTYQPGHWVSLSENSGKYTLTVQKYPEAYENPAGSGRMHHTHKVLMFVFPSSVYGGFTSAGPMDSTNPAAVWWWNFNKTVFMAPDQYGMVSYLSVPQESYQKYVITLNVEQPAE